MNKFMLPVALALAMGVAGVGYAAEPANNISTLPSSNSSATHAQSQGGATASINLSEDQIKAAQQQLKSAGLYHDPVDGKMGPETKEAIQKFQQQRGLRSTGALDQQTLAALQSNTGEAGSSAMAAVPSSSSGSNNGSSGTKPQR